MVVNFILFSIKFPQCEQKNLNEWDKLSTDQPDVHQPYIGSGWQLPHHTLKISFLIVNVSNLPDEECSEHQHDSEIHCQSSLKVKAFIEGC